MGKRPPGRLHQGRALAMPDQGALFVAYGPAAHRQLVDVALPALRRQAPQLPAAVLADTPPRGLPPGVHFLHQPSAHPLARDAKLSIYERTPFDHTLYLDADTECLTSPLPLLAMLETWPLVLAPSQRQDRDVLGHVSPEERAFTLDQWGTSLALGFQCGVLAFRRCPEVAALFGAWQHEWRRWRDQDQAAFLRALARHPLPLWLVSSEWNGGACVAHHFGKARGK